MDVGDSGHTDASVLQLCEEQPDEVMRWQIRGRSADVEGPVHLVLGILGIRPDLVIVGHHS